MILHTQVGIMRFRNNRIVTGAGLMALALLCAQPQTGRAAPIELITNGVPPTECLPLFADEWVGEFASS